MDGCCSFANTFPLPASTITLCKLLLVGSLTNTKYTKKPLWTVSLAELACEFAPTAFSAIVTALLKLLCTWEPIACLIVGLTCIEPVQLELAAALAGLAK